MLSDGRISPEQQLKDANDALVVARGKRGEVEAAYEQVKAALASSAGGGEGVGEALHSPVIEKLRADQADAGARRGLRAVDARAAPSELSDDARAVAVGADADRRRDQAHPLSQRTRPEGGARRRAGGGQAGRFARGDQPAIRRNPYRARPPERRSRGAARRLREGAVGARERASRHRRIAAQRRRRSAVGEARQGQPTSRDSPCSWRWSARSIFGSSPSSPPNTVTVVGRPPPQSRPRRQRPSRLRRPRPLRPRRRRPPRLRPTRRRAKRRPRRRAHSRSTSPSPPSPRGPTRMARTTAAPRLPPPKRR